MSESNHSYIAIDLKSFFASVECVERKLDPLDTHLVVADARRTDKTICLAVSPSLKAYGLSGRSRLFEVVQKARQANQKRLEKIPSHRFSGKSFSAALLQQHPDWELDYITAVPRMSYYINYSARIYNIYLQYVAPEDIFAYSIDEVFIDATSYLKSYKMTAHELTKRIIQTILQQTGITATAGIGTNLYLCKIAMDIVAKHTEPDKDGVRIAELDENSFRKLLWAHQPITDFWRIGKGYASQLAQHGLYTMGDIARCSLDNEDLLYKLFGVNAELLIDHAWGWEPCTIEQIKKYKPENNSFSSGQVLQCPYSITQARIVIQEMADALSLKLIDKKLETDQIVLTVGYDPICLSGTNSNYNYSGKITTDHYGRKVPKEAHGTSHLGKFTSSAQTISKAVCNLYDSIVNPHLLVRRLNIAVCNVCQEKNGAKEPTAIQLDLFTDYQTLEKQEEEERKKLSKERKVQETILHIKKEYGKNAILKGLNFQEGATAIERNKQIGGHNA